MITLTVHIQSHEVENKIVFEIGYTPALVAETPHEVAVCRVIEATLRNIIRTAACKLKAQSFSELEADPGTDIDALTRAVRNDIIRKVKEGE